MYAFTYTLFVLNIFLVNQLLTKKIVFVNKKNCKHIYVYTYTNTTIQRFKRKLFTYTI